MTIRSFLPALYIALAVLNFCCSETIPEPACMKAEVVGKDCDNRWYILRLVEDAEKPNTSGSYIGLH